MNTLLLIPAATLLLAGSLIAAPFDKVREAFEAQKFDRAAELARPLADAGDAQAQELLGHLSAVGQGVAQNHQEAIQWFKRAARAGQKPSTLTIPTALYEEGFSAKKDNAAAFKLYLQAAEEDNHFAQGIVGSLYVHGLGVKENFSEAMKWFRKSSEQGNIYAPSGVGWLYKEGKSVPVDYAEALKWFRLGLSRGDNENPVVNIAHMHQMGWGVKQDYVEARRLYWQAAKLGNQWAQNGLGTLHLMGWGGPKDHAHAIHWLKKSAAQGNAYAPNGLGYIYKEGLAVKQNYAQAAQWFRLGIERGDKIYAVTGLANLLYHGQGVTQDYAESARLFRQAAELGDQHAQFGLGLQYHLGFGMTQDNAEAFKWYLKSAEQGHPVAAGYLAWFYREGLGTRIDYAQSLRWAKAGVEQDDLSSITSLAILYDRGQGAAKDYVQAAKLYRRAIERGNEQWAQYSLGALYEDGRGVPQDFVLAYRWYVASAAQGNESAREKMNKLRPTMTPEQVAEAQRLASSKTAQTGTALPVSVANAPPAPQPLESDVDKPGFKLAENASRFALVVGIEKYKDLPEALFAERDAEAVREYLRALGTPERNIVFLAGANATATGLKKYLEEWLPRNVMPGSTVFFYFSGHGAPDPRTGEAFLVPWDGDAKFLASTALSLRSLYSSLGRLKSQTIVALDACFSGAGGRSVLTKGARPLVNKVDRAAPQGLTVLAASGADEITATLEEQGHGLFTYHLLKGLGGRARDPAGRVTPRGLHDYLLPKVQDDARRQNREQTPALQGPEDVELAVFQ